LQAGGGNTRWQGVSSVSHPLAGWRPVRIVGRDASLGLGMLAQDFTVAAGASSNAESRRGYAFVA